MFPRNPRTIPCKKLLILNNRDIFIEAWKIKELRPRDSDLMNVRTLPVIKTSPRRQDQYPSFTFQQGLHKRGNTNIDISAQIEPFRRIYIIQKIPAAGLRARPPGPRPWRPARQPLTRSSPAAARGGGGGERGDAVPGLEGAGGRLGGPRGAERDGQAQQEQEAAQAPSRHLRAVGGKRAGRDAAPRSL